MSRGQRSLGGALVLAAALSACADPGTGDTGSDTAGLSGDLTVLAAASLHEVLADVADLFTAQHPGTEVSFSFAGSADLVAQLAAGAPADVLTTADEATMATAVADGTVTGDPVVFAENSLTLITPAGNPAQVTGLDTTLADAHLVVCAPQVPCGAATATLAERLAVDLEPVSEENSVTDVLGKVTSGQADAGLVYRTEAAAAGDAVEVVPVPGAAQVVNRYPVAVGADTEHPELAAAWVELLGGSQAQDVLASAGFGTP